MTQSFDKRDTCFKHGRQIQAEDSETSRAGRDTGPGVCWQPGNLGSWRRFRGVRVALPHFPKWGSHRYQLLLLARVWGL